MECPCRPNTCFAGSESVQRSKIQTKDVKKWESGTSLPTDTKIIAALEGLLGKEISQTLESNDFKPIKTSEKIIEDSLFTIDKEKNVDLKSGIFNRFKSDKEKKQKNTTSEMNVFDVYSDKEVIDDDKKIDFDELYENALEERPYIADPKQLSFYFSRNIKTFISVSILLYIAVKAFQMFLNSFNLFIDNLLEKEDLPPSYSFVAGHKAQTKSESIIA